MHDDVFVDAGFEELDMVFKKAFARVTEGKGKERHNPEGNTPFINQPILEIARRQGLGYLTGQAEKKMMEVPVLLEKYGYDNAINELLDVMVYSAAAVIYLEEQKRRKLESGSIITVENRMYQSNEVIDIIKDAIAKNKDALKDYFEGVHTGGVVKDA